MRRHFEARGQPPFRTDQVTRWIYEAHAEDFSRMTDLPAVERTALAEAFRLDVPESATVAVSADGTAKHLWKLDDSEYIESVLIPAPGRLTLCISSQAGCAMGCTFCATGWTGFRRQLRADEIVAQYREAVRWARSQDYGPVTNVVYMGMGEPLANRRGVFPSLRILNAGYGVGARRITVSTVGLVPGIRELAARPEQFRLALSLHAPESDLRRTLIPLEARYPLAEVMDAVEEFAARGGRRVTFEYTMIRDVNDDPALVPLLADLANRVGAFVNLIPFNPIPYKDWRPSSARRVGRFERGLREAGVAVAVREPRGRDIDAACGQLRANHRPGDPQGARARTSA